MKKISLSAVLTVLLLGKCYAFSTTGWIQSIGFDNSQTTHSLHFKVTNNKCIQYLAQDGDFEVDPTSINYPGDPRGTFLFGVSADDGCSYTRDWWLSYNVYYTNSNNQEVYVGTTHYNVHWEPDPLDFGANHNPTTSTSFDEEPNSQIIGTPENSVSNGTVFIKFTDSIGGK